jgi:hypothetical protein
VINFENIEGCDQFKSLASRSGLPDLLAKSEFINLDWNQVGDILKVRSKEEVQRETYQANFWSSFRFDANICTPCQLLPIHVLNGKCVLFTYRLTDCL